ncbi:MAG: hypothetical protein GXY26_07620 [Clostridiales bacterium]|nr:hypothetical protein [Clostridiales bacterium]
MRKKGPRSRYKNIGCFIIVLGVFVLLALVLPPTFWWFILGSVLICVGIWVCKCR